MEIFFLKFFFYQISLEIEIKTKVMCNAAIIDSEN